MEPFGSLTLWFPFRNAKPSGNTVSVKSFKALSKYITSDSGNQTHRINRVTFIVDGSNFQISTNSKPTFPSGHPNNTLPSI